MIRSWATTLKKEIILGVYNVEQPNLQAGDTYLVEDTTQPGGIWRTLFVNAGRVIINIPTLTTIIILGSSKGLELIVLKN